MRYSEVCWIESKRVIYPSQREKTTLCPLLQEHEKDYKHSDQANIIFCIRVTKHFIFCSLCQIQRFYNRHTIWFSIEKKISKWGTETKQNKNPKTKPKNPQGQENREAITSFGTEAHSEDFITVLQKDGPMSRDIITSLFLINMLFHSILSLRKRHTFSWQTQKWWRSYLSTAKNPNKNEWKLKYFIYWNICEIIQAL